MERLVMFVDANDGTFVIEDRRYDQTGSNRVLILTFANGEIARGCFNDLYEVHNLFDGLTELVNTHDPNLPDVVFQGMTIFLEIACRFSTKYGFGAITPFLRNPWNDFEGRLGKDLTGFNDEISGGITSREAGPSNVWDPI
jgi:hypothetical protein